MQAILKYGVAASLYSIIQRRSILQQTRDPLIELIHAFLSPEAYIRVLSLANLHIWTEGKVGRAGRKLDNRNYERIQFKGEVVGHDQRPEKRRNVTSDAAEGVYQEITNRQT